jgi:hypothetical protein
MSKTSVGDGNYDVIGFPVFDLLGKITHEDACRCCVCT